MKRFDADFPGTVKDGSVATRAHAAWVRVSLVAIVAIVGCATLAGAFLVSCGIRAPSAKIRLLMDSTADPAKRAKLAEIGRLHSKAAMHHGMIEETAVLLAGAERNLDALVYAARLMGSVGFHTQVIYAVAESAASAKRELPEFATLLELSVRKLSGSEEVKALARAASIASTDDEVATVRSRIDDLGRSAECATVEEAVKKVEETLDKLADPAARR